MNKRSEISGNLNLFGQQWSLSLEPTEQYITDNDDQHSLWYASAIMISWGILAVFAHWIHMVNQQLFAAKQSLEVALETVQSSERHYAQLSRHDPLTGLLNRRAFFEHLEQEMSRAERFEQSLCILLADIDEFKKVNDNFGHLTGDHVLQAFADVCRSSCREQDVICRYGGEEFAVLMINTDTEEGLTISNRLLAEVSHRQTQVVDSDKHISVTFSGGLTTLRAGDGAKSLLARADNALYQSKHLGRNRITVA